MKLLVVGIDGASFAFLGRFLEAGVMPNLAELMGRGRHGVLKSTLPPATAPAWVSCFSGVNPGRHGVFNFVAPSGPGRLRPVSSQEVGVPRLWNLLGDRGWKVHVLDVPMTFPPEPVSGVMVSDWMTSGHARARTHPPELQPVLQSIARSSHGSAIADGLSVTAAFLRHLQASVEDKSRLDDYILGRFPADAVITVYQHIDVLSHYFWHVVDVSHPAFPPRVARRLSPGIRAVVAAVDKALGRMLERASEETLVAVVSDHGFGGVTLRIHLNDLLLRWGLLDLEGPARYMLRWKRRGITLSHMVALARKLDVAGVLRRLVPFHAARAAAERLSFGAGFAHGDTAAWFPHGLAPGIVVFGRTRAEKEATVARLLHRLRRLRTPGGVPCFDVVARREEVYHGPRTAGAPDIVLQVAAGMVLTAEITGGGGFSRALPGQVSGFHRPDGVYVFSGPAVREKGPGDPLSIQDTVPSILEAFGEDSALRLDGVPAPWIRRGRMAPLPEKDLTRSTRDGGGPNYTFDQGEAEEISRRLEALGYW